MDAMAVRVRVACGDERMAVLVQERELPSGAGRAETYIAAFERARRRLLDR